MAPDISPRYLAAGGVAGGYAALALDGGGVPLWRCDLAARAHDIAVHRKSGLCAVIDRKPGKMARICDLATGAVISVLLPLSGCSFDGHAAFSTDGATLFTTQSAAAGQIGQIVVYDLASGRISRHFPSHGIEPHELVWLKPDRLLAVGNGGIVDRRSADPIDSSLVLINAADGSLCRQWILDDELETLSIRHLARLPGDRVVFAAQDQDAATDIRPLLGIADPAGGLNFLTLPATIHRRLDGYIGGVAVDSRGDLIAATAPRGGLALFWSASDRRHLGAVEMSDVCGVAATGEAGTFHLTSGHGGQCRVRIEVASGGISELELNFPPVAGLQWDNHLTWIGA
ncbi:MAG: DUF1513 domain-containing protein [Rhodospirillaceae bacterium]|nr:DUF1513 domain-containing protein [Rhodospirillaceae bacterium]